MAASGTESREASIPPSDLAALLQDVKPRKLGLWISELLHNYRWPLPFFVGRQSPIDAILDLYTAPALREYRRKFRAAILGLFRSLTLFDESPEFLGDIFTLMGAIELREAYDELVAIANSGELQGVEAPDRASDLHRVLLAAIVAMRAKPNSLGLLERDVYDPRYFSVCFRALWELDVQNAVRFSHSIMLHGRDSAHFPDLAVAMDGFLRSTPLDYVAGEYLPAVLPSLGVPDGLFDVFDKALLQSSFQVRFADKQTQYCVGDTELGRTSEWFPLQRLPMDYIVHYWSNEVAKYAGPAFSVAEMMAQIKAAFESRGTSHEPRDYS